MDMLISFLVFAVGAIFGSFTNVLIDRLPRGESVLFGRSHCDSCKKKLSSFDMIPLLSFLLLGGKCRYCKKKIGIRTFATELSMGVLFLLLFVFSYTTPLPFVFLCICTVLLYAIALIDIDHGIIPDSLLVVLTVLSAGYVVFLIPQAFPSHLAAGVISFLFFLFIFAITKGRGIGFGDVKYAFVIGFLLGPWLSVIAFYGAFLTGAVISIILVVVQKKKLKGSTVPFGPFLSLGVFMSLICGARMLQIVIPYFT